MTEWLAAWDPQKASFVIELGRAANQVAPAKTWPIMSAGLRYVTTRPAPAGQAAPEYALEATWHHAAIGLLQQHRFADYEDRYLEALHARMSSTATALAIGRFALARGVAQEHRCWNDRPSLERAGPAADAIPRAAGQSVASTMGLSKSEKEKIGARLAACQTDAVTRFDRAAGSEAGAEARVRGAWMRVQLGQFAEAFRTIEAVDPGGDRVLAYWAGLVRGRIADALGRHADAERAYRDALAAAPHAQSAGIGLALSLFKLNRDVEADAAGLAADHRFVDAWSAALREARR
jgi:hypothetical protein